MNNYLDKIMATKPECIASAKRKCSLPDVKAMCADAKPAIPFAQSIKERNGIIAEFKRQSPSKGLIHGNIMPQDVVQYYEEAGVSAVSVLTKSFLVEQ